MGYVLGDCLECVNALPIKPAGFNRNKVPHVLGKWAYFLNLFSLLLSFYGFVSSIISFQ